MLSWDEEITPAAKPTPAPAVLHAVPAAAATAATATAAQTPAAVPPLAALTGANRDEVAANAPAADPARRMNAADNTAS